MAETGCSVSDADVGRVTSDEEWALLLLHTHWREIDVPYMKTAAKQAGDEVVRRLEALLERAATLTAADPAMESNDRGNL